MPLKVTDPVRFVRNFVPATTVSYSFDDEGPRRQILSEFVQSFIVAINSLSNEYRISQLLGKANDIAACVRGDRANAGTWNDRFGFEVFIESIELTEQSRQLVQQFASNRMNVAAYEGVSPASWQYGCPAAHCARHPRQRLWRWRHVTGHEYGASHQSYDRRPGSSAGAYSGTGSRCSRLSHGIHVCGRTSRGDEKNEASAVFVG